MARTVVGLYDHISKARSVVEALDKSGFDRDDISLVANASAKEYATYFDDEGQYKTDVDDDHMTSGEGAAAGAGIGATIGGIGGLLMGLGLLAVPGVGPALAAGPIVSALVGAGIGAVAGGLTGALVNSGVPEEEASYYAEGVRRGGSLVMITVADDRVGDVERIMNDHNPVDIEERVARWKEDGWTGYDEKAEPYSVEDIATEQEQYSIPVVEENIKVGKREVESGGVRVRSYVREVPVEETVSLKEESVHVERRDVDRPVTDADAAFEEKTIELTETKEEAVVAKEARVTGEVVVDRSVQERTETVTDTIRKTEVEVEDINTSVNTSGYENDVDYYREHYSSSFADSGRDYDHYEPAYKYGSRIAHEDEFRSKAWVDVQSEARRRWEERNPNSWSDYEGAIRHSYEREGNRV